MKNALVIGSTGTIGRAIVERLSDVYNVAEIHRENCDYSEATLAAHFERLSERGTFDLIICCIGVLHNENLSPEKRIGHLSQESLLEYFRINSVLPGLCLKHFTPLLRRASATQTDDSGRSEVSKFVVLSAMVGSISDNKLGGWYGYRSSKAALNMLLKTAAIEVGRVNKRAALVAVHPGTTVGPLSKPFAGGVAKDNYYTPSQSADRIVSLAEQLNYEDNGRFINWDGKDLSW